MSKNKQRKTNPLEKKLSLYLQNMLWYNLEYERENRKELHYFRLDLTENIDG